MILNLHGFLAPILGAVGGSLISGLFGNAQQKANQQAQQNAQNQGEQFSAQQLQKMIDFIKSQQQSAFSNLSGYLKANPNPAANLPPIALPNQIDMPTIGGQSIGANGAATGASTQAPLTNPNSNSMLLDALFPALLQQFQQFQQANAPAPPPAPAPAPTRALPGPIRGGNLFNGRYT